MTKHQPDILEYRYAENGSENDGSIYWMAREGHAYCVAKAPRYETKEQWEANAARIVHTWNCHDELVGALEKIASVLDIESYPTNGSLENRLGNIARDALKLAKGE